MSNRVLSRISPYEDRRLGYPCLTIRQNSERFSTVWHRLPADSLTSPPIPVAVGPLMVELFTVECLVRSPRVSAPVWSVARRTAPHVSTVERTRHDSKPMSPRDGIRHSIATPALFRTAQRSNSSTMTIDPLSMSASPEFKMKRTNPELFHRDTILRSQCCSCLRRESSRTTVVAGLLTRPPYNCCGRSPDRATRRSKHFPPRSDGPQWPATPTYHHHRIERWDYSETSRAHILSEPYDRF